MAVSTTSTILVVDDEVKLLPGLSRLIINALPTCSVRVCYRGADVLRYMEQTSPRMVITDDQMPIMDGFTLAQTITTRWPSIPVVLMTNVATPDVYDAAQCAGCVAVVTKSLHPTTLASIVEQTLSSYPYSGGQRLGGSVQLAHGIPAPRANT